MAHTPRSRRTSINKMKDYIRVILDVHAYHFVMSVNEQDGETMGSGEEGPDIIVGLSSHKSTAHFALTSLTHDELCAMREFFEVAFTNAQYVIIERDRIAKEALENGDDSYERVYRAFPAVIVREGTKWEHYPRIRRGLEWLTTLDSFLRVRTVNLREPDAILPESDQGRGEPRDDQEEARNLQDLREVGLQDLDSGRLLSSNGSEAKAPPPA